ncbi:phenazine biosynthesis protein PhzF family [Streptomyces sp. WMMB 714]|jgi:predicted PhzF superfamily epimerase YddE/YHI9|uniref:PhzF family phenazine biosynthesis protein n=1 Tax=Streptomyces sp. WMMB 714 TaxID=1286822 RepID=UPI0005F812F1|nr:PhzF family phenazine biosynthesis protein [Streptomyces sp. WMMB 714]SCK52366.1 phenazine biosynthesis protein PhzF family [Streptomyces sp. WMMB 714]
MRIRTVDAFTDRPWTGNPAAVVLLEDSSDFPSDERLQRVALEMNLSETAFAHPLRDDPGADWALRWFTPTAEVDLCGHATLATAHVLHGDGATRAADGPVRFRTRSGVLTAATGPDGDITLDFPTAPLTRVTPPAEVQAGLGSAPVAVHDTGPLGDLLVELPDEAAVRAVTPDPTALLRLPHRAVIVTALAADPAGSGYDYVSRVFGPAVGIPEDPVTGSAHTALAPLWSGRLGSDVLTGLQCSARTGRVRTALRGERTELTGSAVTVLDARLRVEF